MQTRERSEFQGTTNPQEPTTTVITIGLTPPIIGGGLALGYLAVKRLQNGAGSAQAQSSQPGVAEKAGAAATGMAGGASQALGTAAEVAGGSVQTVAATAGRVIGGATAAAGTGTDAVRSTAMTAMREVPRLAQENPALTLGLGIGIGALAGLLIPATRTESELIRPASETVAQQVKTAAQETVEKVQLVADEAATTIKESAADVGLVPSGTTGG
jgi:ElaB/YqjD/DUF883 family membrane-anchored ribosome-binding protein